MEQRQKSSKTTPKATYEGWCKGKDVIIDWDKPVSLIHDLIRGSDPSPGARTYSKGDELRLYGSAIVSSVNKGLPGEVIQITEEGMMISCNGGVLRIKKVKPANHNKCTAVEWAKTFLIEPGSRFGNTK
ncbi:MAG: hypothetical protein CM1200mP8_4370 [Chloroflexota bacterium]|nr:MAG: hypothetical protein CM1200mP8_4370 [Chloroflexota bacterium]